MTAIRTISILIFILGYVPKAENAEIAKMLDMGWADVFTAELTTVKKHGNINDRLRISIFIQSKDPVVVKPDMLRIHSLDFEGFKATIDELQSLGFASFRWGGFAETQLDFPVVGDKIVLLHRQNNTVVMFLTRVLCKGDDCSAFLDPDVVNYVDDCLSFILTNIAGPITVDLDDLDFLGTSTLEGRDVFENLSVAESECLKEIFDERLNAWQTGIISTWTVA